MDNAGRFKKVTKKEFLSFYRKDKLRLFAVVPDKLGDKRKALSIFFLIKEMPDSQIQEWKTRKTNNTDVRSYQHDGIFRSVYSFLHAQKTFFLLETITKHRQKDKRDMTGCIIYTLEEKNKNNLTTKEIK